MNEPFSTGWWIQQATYSAWKHSRFHHAPDRPSRMFTSQPGMTSSMCCQPAGVWNSAVKTPFRCFFAAGTPADAALT
jgi:hypothetical protein